MQTQTHPALFEPFAEAQQGLPVLGHLVWWSVPAATEVALPDLEEHLQRAGLQANLVPRVQARGALSTALKRLETGNMVRRVTEDPEKIVLALVAEEVDRAALVVDYTQVQTVVYHKASKSLDFVNGAHADQIRELFARYRRTLTASQVRGLVRRALDQTDPVTVKPGLIFVPRQHQGMLRAVGCLLGRLHGGASLGTLGVVDSTETRATMLRVVREELEGEIERAKDELNAVLAEDGVRATTLARRLETFRRVRAKVSGYADLLQFSAQDLLERIHDLEEHVKRAL